VRIGTGRSLSIGVDVLLAALCALSLACVSALKEPPPLADLAGDETPGPPADPSEVADLLARATTLFARREVGAVREASRFFLRAAAAEGAPREALVGAARAEIWLTDHDADAAQRQRAATLAVRAAQWCRRGGDRPEPECDYWLGAALGVQARELPTTALSALPKIVELFTSASQGFPILDEAGPDRALALLYVRAPGWPTGPGDPDLGLRHARSAVELRPDYPPNRLALAEALVATGNSAAARSELTRALDLARAMEGQGDRDAPEWVAEAEKGLRQTVPVE
jgi:hypothetical protein